MNWLHELITNRFLITGVSSWFVAQLAKTIIHAIINKKLVLERMVGDGGMPSGHSATVTSLAMISGLSYGFDSFQFAVTALLAIIVCHDAMGVRLETGKQAMVLNELTKAFEALTKYKAQKEKDQLEIEKLKAEIEKLKEGLRNQADIPDDGFLDAIKGTAEKTWGKTDV